jgi:ATP-dependent Clp protease ATP-binding subunit ClpX
MRAILTETKNNLIRQYQWLFEQDDIELEFDNAAIDCMVDRAMASSTGARALHTEMERVLMPHMYDICQYRSLGQGRVIIDRDLVNNPQHRKESI